MEIVHQPQFDMHEAVRAGLEQLAQLPRIALDGLRMYMRKKNEEDLKKIREQSGQVEKDPIKIRGTQMHDQNDDDDHEQGGRITLPPPDRD